MEDITSRLFGDTQVLTFQEAAEFVCKIESQLNGESIYKELYQEFLKAAYECATIRAQWHFMALEEQAENDTYRSSLHNSFIDACNILSRYMSNKGVDSTWKDRLGDRRKIGDFACYVTAITCIWER